MKHVFAPQAVSTEQLIAMIAHDLRTPVTAIKGFTQLALRQKNVPSNLQNHLEMVVTETNRIASLIDDLVLLGQIDQGSTIIHPGFVALGDVARQLVAEWPDEELDLGATLSPASEEIDAWCDRALTTRALTHLTRMAVHYFRRRVPITVAVASHQNGALIVVSSNHGTADEGDGAADLALEGKLAPDADLSLRKLSLYICGRLIEEQRGKVWIEQLPEGGTQFMVTLPTGVNRAQVPSTIASEGDRQQWS